jgi:hypothetical protein
MVLRFKARYDGTNLIPEKPLEIPAGAMVEVEITSSITSVHRKSDPDVQRVAAKAQSAADRTLRMPKSDLPVEQRIAKRSSDEVSSSG